MSAVSGKIDGGLLLAQALANEGVERVFTLCGAHIMPAYYGCKTLGIEIVDVRHEAAAGYAANSYAQTTGKPGVIITTAGPGVLNATTAMVEARDQGSPLLHIGGGAALGALDTRQMQETNTLEIMSPCSVWSRRVYATHRLGEYVAEAFRNACGDAPGPAYLEVPADVLSANCDSKWADRLPQPWRYSSPLLERSVVEGIAAALARAERPVLVVGDGIRYFPDAAAKIAALARQLGMPVHPIGLARGFVGDEAAYPRLRAGVSTVVNADLILCLQVRPDFRAAMVSAANRRGAALVSVHTDSHQIIRGIHPSDRSLSAAPDGVCAQLLEALDGHSVAETSQAWLEQSVAYTEQERTAWLTGFNSSKQPMHPGRCAHEVAEFLRREQPEFTVVADGGDSSLWIREAVTVSAPGQLISWGPNGTIGTGLGFAIGAWFGRRKPVLLFTGDGSFGFHATELDTVARFQIPLIVVIANDSAWGVIKGTEQLIRPAAVAEHGNLATEFSEMLHYEKLGEIWGIDGELVRDFDEIGAALRRAVSTGRPYIINVEISQEDFSPVIAAYGASVKSGG